MQKFKLFKGHLSFFSTTTSQRNKIVFKRPLLSPYLLTYFRPCMLTSLVSLVPGLVLFLEEDHHVAEDFLHVLRLVDGERRRLGGGRTNNCDIICLGTYMKNFNYARNHKTVSQEERN